MNIFSAWKKLFVDAWREVYGPNGPYDGSEAGVGWVLVFCGLILVCLSAGFWYMGKMGWEGSVFAFVTFLAAGLVGWKLSHTPRARTKHIPDI